VDSPFSWAGVCTARYWLNANGTGLTNQWKQDKMASVPYWGMWGKGAAMGTEEITNRLKRVEGQVRGLQRMVEEHRDCEAILTQLMAARAALDRVGLLVAENFVQECLMTEEGDLARERVGRVLELVFSRFSVPVEASGNMPEDLVRPNEEG
jgi:DNA-binding FrmR family transcriptional regulator